MFGAGGAPRHPDRRHLWRPSIFCFHWACSTWCSGWSRGHGAGPDGAPRAGRAWTTSSRTRRMMRHSWPPIHFQRTPARLERPAPGAEGAMSFRVHVRVMPRGGLLDPQGQAVEHALGGARLRRGGQRPRRTGHRARRGGGLPRRGRGAGPADVRQAARQSGHRGLPARGGGGLMLKVAVVRFPGSNCDLDALRAAERVGTNAYLVWHRDTGLHGADVVILPGGFSYGDYLRSGAIARFSPIMQAVQRHAADGRAGARHLQRLPDPVRGPPAARRADAERGPHIRLEAGGRRGRARPTRSSPRPTRRATGSGIPVAHGDGRFVGGRRHAAHARGRRPGRAAVRVASEDSPFSPTRTGPPTTSPASGTPRAPWSASCRIPSAWPTRSSGCADGLGFFTSLAAWQPRDSMLRVPSQ